MKNCRPFTNYEVAQIIEHGFTGRFANRNRALFVLGISTGFKIPELLTLRIKDILTDSGQIRDAVNIPLRHRVGNSPEREEHVGEFAKKQIEKYVEELQAKHSIDSSRPMFFSGSNIGTPITEAYYGHVLRLACRSAGIEKGNISNQSIWMTHTKILCQSIIDEYEAGNIEERAMLYTVMHRLRETPDTISDSNLSFILDELECKA